MLEFPTTCKRCNDRRLSSAVASEQLNTILASSQDCNRCLNLFFAICKTRLVQSAGILEIFSTSGGSFGGLSVRGRMKHHRKTQTPRPTNPRSHIPSPAELAQAVCRWAHPPSTHWRKSRPPRPRRLRLRNHQVRLSVGPIPSLPNHLRVLGPA